MEKTFAAITNLQTNCWWKLDISSINIKRAQSGRVFLHVVVKTSQHCISRVDLVSLGNNPMLATPMLANT